VRSAYLTAQRRAARDEGEPSTPTTILVTSAGIRTSSFRLYRSYRSYRSCTERMAPDLAYVGPLILGVGDQSPPDDAWRSGPVS
jgi:hypothetical protein